MSGSAPPAQSETDPVAMIFATPMVILDWPESEALDAALMQLVARARAAGPGVGKSNVGGWHSPESFVRGDAPSLGVLRERIRSTVIDLTRRFMKPGDYRFGLDGWANILGPGNYNGPHNHPNATWSGVYYLTGVPDGPAAPDGEVSVAGKIEFFDPRPAAGMVYAVDNLLQRRCLFAPRPGCMLVFPGWLQHMVHPHFGAGERQSIAFNVTVGLGSKDG